MANRKCRFCANSVDMIHDDDRTRAYQCGQCLAVEIITKGTPSKSQGISPWWYHGTQRLDKIDGSNGERIDGDGRVIDPAPCDFAAWTQRVPSDALMS